jgi:prepilin-type N-terminal cleavage/methylation domain-containing protein
MGARKWHGGKAKGIILRMIHPSFNHPRRAFTMVELMVSIGILAILMALLLPVIGKARRQAKVTACASNLHQLCLAINNFAATNDGAFPNLDIPGATGGNTWDISHNFYDTLLKQGLMHQAFFCPAAEGDINAVNGYSFNYYSTFYVIRYNVWIQRKNGSDTIPPSNNYSGTRFTIVLPNPMLPFAGPADQNDSLAACNPVITDIIASKGVTPPANADATAQGNPYNIVPGSNHMDGTQLLGVNEGFADGHVECRHPSQIKPYYMGNYWNWR